MGLPLGEVAASQVGRLGIGCLRRGESKGTMEGPGLSHEGGVSGRMASLRISGWGGRGGSVGGAVGSRGGRWFSFTGDGLSVAVEVFSLVGDGMDVELVATGLTVMRVELVLR